MNMIEIKKLTKNYVSGDVSVAAIKGTDFSIEPASFVAFVGPSGSGKSTLLNLIGCLDHPSSGKLTVAGTDIATLDRQTGAKFRAEHIGFVFQDFNLIPVLTVFENIEYPLQMVQEWPADKRRQQGLRLLEAVGMSDQADKRPDQLSGGQKQRVAVARALVSNPKLVLADEPTANLDSQTSEDLLRLMRRLNEEQGTTFIFSSHDPQVIHLARRVIRLKDGRLESDRPQSPEAGA